MAAEGEVEGDQSPPCGVWPECVFAQGEEMWGVLIGGDRVV